MTKDQKEALEQGFIQVGLSVVLYLVYAILGFVSAILIGYIIPILVSVWVQGIVIILTQGLGGYFALKTLQSEDSKEAQ